MFIEQWKDTAFGSDYGSDFQSFLEELPHDKLSFTILYKYCDLKKYFDHPELLNQRTDNNVKLNNSNFDQFVHYEDALIALAAIVAESELNGSADLTDAYGTKVLTFEITKEELTMLKNALVFIQENTAKFVLFEMLGEYKDETLSDLASIVDQLTTCINNK